MQSVIYAGLRNPERDQQIVAALSGSTTAEVAEEFRVAPSTVRAAAKRISDLHLFSLRLIGGG